MKKLLFILSLVMITTCSFGQKVDTITPPDPVDTTALDTLDHFDNPKELILFLQVHADGTVDSLWVPVGGSVGDFTPTTKPAFVSLVDSLVNLLWPLLAVLLTFLSSFIPGLRNIKVNVLSDKRLRSVVVSGLVLVGGFFVKFNDVGTWLTYIAQNLDFFFVSSGIYALALKPLLSKIFKPKQ